MKYNIYRTHLSGYWPKNFLELEKNALTKLDQCSYHGLQLTASQWLKPAIILSNTHFNPNLIEQHEWKKVALILHANSGFDNLLSDNFLNSYEGPLLFAPNLRAQAVAEYNLQAWMTGLGQIPYKKHWDNQREFKRRLASYEKVLLIGYGHVGKITAKMVLATGASVDVYDPYIHQESIDSVNMIKKIEWSQYTSILFCCSLTESSRLLLTQSAWQQLQPSVILINATRGPLLNFSEACHFAHLNKDAKIFLDVFEQEPFNHYQDLPANIFTSSHIAGVHDQLLEETHQWHYHMIHDFLLSKPHEFLIKHQQQDLRQQRQQL